MSARTATNSPATANGRSRLAWTAVVLEVLLSAAALGGAIALVTGAIDLGGSTQDLPFGSPVLAGVALALCNAVLPAVVAAGELRGRGWARPGHLAVGAVLMGWIVVQVAFIGLGSWLQVGYFVYGAVILAVGFLLGWSDPAGKSGRT
jgi:hypothetical protein